MVRVLSFRDLRCPVSRKRAYVDEATANEVIEKAWATDDWGSKHGTMPTRAYLCDECGWWHLTHLSQQRRNGQ